MPRINRIRLEFKEGSAMEQEEATSVLIESDWNLKQKSCNLCREKSGSINRIRLEFKDVLRCLSNALKNRINRIRLEFKDISSHPQSIVQSRINRIRLEFKERCLCSDRCCCKVLIESDWNLKELISALKAVFENKY